MQMSILAALIADRFDRVVIGVIAVLVGAICLVLMIGDQAGVGVLEMAPVGEARVTTPIRLQFSERMNSQSVESHFSIDPPLSGRFSWIGTGLTFYPEHAWQLGVSYTVTVKAGAQAQQGRTLRDTVRWTFSPGAPRVIYLAPAGTVPDSEAPNLWLYDPQNPGQTHQLTSTVMGIAEFQPSPDGTRVVYVQSGIRGASDLYLLDLQTNSVQRITNCGAVDAMCLAPAWSPDGTRIAYERRELSPDLPESDQNVPRTWIVNLRDLSTAPLLASSLLLGAAPVWSPDGTRIAVFDLNQGGIVIYDFTTAATQSISTEEGESGMYAFAPDSKRFVFPELVIFPGRFTTELSMVDLSDPTQSITKLSGVDKPPVEDAQPTWHPDGTRLAFTRRWLDGSGSLNAQIYQLDFDQGTIVPLIQAPEYIHGAVSWSPAGDKLVMQRFSPNSGESVPSIWVYEPATETLVKIAEDAYLPRWMP